MKVCVFLILMVTQVILCDKATSKLRRKLIVPKINDQCKKIKCAPTEEPECVKLWRPDLGHTFYINVVNKCELEYMKCHEGVEAKIVPMKFCGHGSGVFKANNKKNKTSEAHLRVKRSAKKRRTTTAGNNDTYHGTTSLISTQNKTVLSTSKKSRDLKTHPHEWKHEALNFISKDKDPKNDVRMKKNGGKHGRLNEELGYPYSTDVGSDTENNERKKIGKGLAGHPLSIETDYEVPFQGSPSSPDFQGKTVQINPSEMEGDTGKLSETDSFPLISIETRDNKKVGLAEADKKEHEEICPSVCASRDVMVCARCQHGIYKTFISVCHMRVFSCNHNDEVLELVSRYPCILSAPYLSEQDMIPKGRIVDDTDDDKVLRFIICRDRNQLGSDIPSDDVRCNFRSAKEQLKYYDFRGIGIQIHDAQMMYHSETSMY